MVPCSPVRKNPTGLLDAHGDAAQPTAVNAVTTAADMTRSWPITQT